MEKKSIDQIRESINLRLFGHKNFVLQTLKVLSVFVAFAALGSIIFYYGFPHTANEKNLAKDIITFSFVFYILKYLLQVFYDFDPPKFIRKNLFESIIIAFLIINSILSLIFGISIIDLIFYFTGIEKIADYSIVLLQFYFLIIFMIEIAKGSTNLAIFKLGPSTLLTLSFIILIFGGAGLLILPEMTRNGISFIDALFTSTSASCVTGLSSVDTPTTFTMKGQLIIMVLIQLGGINIISFATFFTTFYNGKVGIKYQSILKDLLSTQGISDNRSILRDILFFSITIELIGTLLIYLSWTPDIHFVSTANKVYFSLFHAVSAFNNAGFSLFTNGLYENGIRTNYNIQIVIMSLIFLGGIGFFVLKDVLSLKKINERRKDKWKKLTISSKIAIRMSVTLILVGAAFFFVLEYNDSLREHSIFGKIIVSLFQSVTTRTAGFNSVDFTKLGLPVLIIFMMLMFIGASPGSTGGGIKTTTFTVILKSAMSTIRGKKNVELFKKNIAFNTIDKAYSIALFSISLIFIGTFILSITEPDKTLIQLMFEEISAFGTVGLSTGITFGLSFSGKIVIIITMFVGRIGTLTLALMLSREISYRHYKYADAHLMIG